MRSRTRASPNSCASTAVDVCVGHRRKILFSIVSAGNHLRFFTDAGQFLERVQPFLLRREAEHCLILGLLDGLRSGDQWGAAPPLMGLVENNGEVAAVALMTPPHNLILSWIGDDSTIDAIAQRTPCERRRDSGCQQFRRSCPQVCGEVVATFGMFRSPGVGAAYLPVASSHERIESRGTSAGTGRVRSTHC